MEIKIYILITLTMIGYLSTISAQKSELVLDTVYNKYMTWKGNYLLIGEGQQSILLKNDIIEPFPMQVENFKAGILGVPLVQIDDKCYLLNDELVFNPEKYIDLKLQNLSYGGQHFQIFGKMASYVKGDAVFVSNFDTHKTDFVLKNAVVSNINENYIWIQNGEEKGDFIYIFKTKKLVKLPPKFTFPNTDHPYFVVHYSIDENIHIIDLNLNDIVLPKEGYTDYYILGELLVVYGKRKPAKIFYKNKLLNLDEEFIDAQCHSPLNICFLTTLSNKISVLNSNGIFSAPAIYDDRILSNEQIILKKGSLVQVYTPDFKLIIEGEFDDVSHVYDDRFFVKKDGRSKVVDTKNSEIISNFPFAVEGIYAFKEYGQKFLFVRNEPSNILYDYNGSEIVSWINQKGDQFANPGKFFRALNFRMLKSLSDEQEKRINPSGIWIKRQKVGRSNINFLCNKFGDRLSNNFRLLTSLNTPGQYLVRTMSKKIGIIRVQK